LGFLRDLAEGAALSRSRSRSPERRPSAGSGRRVEATTSRPPYLLETGSGDRFLYCGDTGLLLREFWRCPAARPGSGGRRAECSFPAADHPAERTPISPRHPPLAAALAGVEAKADLPLPAEKASALATEVAAKLPLPVLVTHVKPFGWRAVTTELERLRKAGIRLMVAERGVCYSY
jgi:hypothetical protein